MNALILINGYSKNRNCLSKARRLQEELGRRDVASDIVEATRLLAYSDGTTDGFFAEGQYDFCIDLDKDIYLAKAIEDTMPLFNSSRSLLLSDDKMKTLLALKGASVPCPLTIAAPLCYVPDPDPAEVARFLDGVEERLGYPLVYKACHGSLGKEVRLIRDRAELERCYLENKALPHLYEKFLSAHEGRDYRVIVVGDRVVAAMERVNERDFRSNIALGGKGYDATRTIPEAFKEVALRASKALDLDYAGIDLAISKDGGPLFLEANGNAFIEAIEKVTKINVAGAFVDHILGKLKRAA